MTDRELELQILAWYQAAVPSSEAAPATLRTSVTAIPRTVARSRVLPGAWRRLVLVAAAALVAVAVGGLLVLAPGLAPSPSSSPATSPLAADTATAAPATPIDTGPPALPAAAGMFLHTVDVVASGDRIAWVATETAIYRTEDTGKTWRAVQPGGWLPRQHAFVDGLTAFASIGWGAEIAATGDGGATWTRTVLDAAGSGNPVFSFSSASSVYATFVDPNHVGQQDGTGLLVFATNDGGGTWSGPTQGMQPPLKAGGKFYQASGAFLVHSSGLSDQYPFENFFYLSEDGGATWTRYDFPTGPLAPKGALKEVTAIVRGLDGHLLIALGVDGGRKSIPVVIYRNGDDPSTWSKIVDVPAPNQQPFQFLSPTSWILTSGAPPEIVSTPDAGATWRTVVPAISLYGVQAGPGPPPSWGSLDTGWAVEDCQWARLPADGGPGAGPDCGDRARDLVLLVTTDGGATWTEVGP